MLVWVSLVWAAAGLQPQEEEAIREQLRRLEETVQAQQAQIEELRRLLQEREAGVTPAASTQAPATSAPSPAPQESSPPEMRVFWKDGLRFESTDGEFAMRLRGRIQADGVWWTDADSDVETAVTARLEDQVKFRRARLGVEATIRRRFQLLAEYDYAGGDADFADVWMGVRDLPGIGRVQVGHMKEPFSLEELTSSLFITFGERSLANALVPARNMGLMASNSLLDGRATWALGMFRETNTFGESDMRGTTLSPAA